jgi:hypothetical protein
MTTSIKKKKARCLYQKSIFKLKSLINLPMNPLQAISPYQIPRSAKYLRVFENTLTGEITAITDLAKQIENRNKKLRLFSQKYNRNRIGIKGHLTLYSIIANIADFPTMDKLMRPLKTRLKRHNIQIKGYIWLRDRGENEFVPHYHLLIVLKRENTSEFEKICSKYKIKIQPQKTCGMANNYLKKKEVFAKHGQRVFGASKTFET